MNSIGDPLGSAPIWEIWGIVWLRYVAAIGLVMVNYDCLLTLDDEVRLILSYLSHSCPPYHLVLGSPCLAGEPFPSKSTLLH
jgi:hypothetical protein